MSVESFACEIPPPIGWRRIENEVMEALGGAPEHCPAYLRVEDKLVVTMTCSIEQDGRKWLHLAASYRDHLPSYRTMCELKRLFIGADKMAYQCFVPEDQHVNIQSYCLHLWHCVDGPVTPDFTRGLGSI